MRADVCKHFTGYSGATKCEAGVEYKSVNNGKTGAIFHTLPCWKRSGIDNCSGVNNCSKREFPTAAEIAANEEMWKQKVQELTIIIPMIDKEAVTGIHTSGKFDCPICKTGQLHWRKASNGHRGAECTTADCVRFIQ